MEWVDGIKLTDEAKLKKASLNRKELINQVLYIVVNRLWFLHIYISTYRNIFYLLVYIKFIILIYVAS